ncbi:hypothetical protein VOLCADRAFT_67775 [Volvox carteri f. nagariensis]|uniref:Uncharacterized protein n=1 Tax=Volvox carteri f. nagariensis TaxID=3068 RepID=D8UEF3_VOLCA|nr:uncharacterized protein VOLCADRAFT_67775 [Volvox carteri f. nagariensis]EFJ41873.1 hypothetical protein VOLCADRAFT_67775 [Volvox carteri f. nagariensis]|eukprot:XP_002957071.1 hypothetical protein VOLCADRAFT_67775 [Volvox carteri f. nagariensis]
MNTNLQAALDEANKCIKRQKLCASKSDAVLDKIIGMVTAAQKELENFAEGSDPEATITSLHKGIEEAGLFKEMNSSTKDLHTSVAKLGKALERALDMDADICRALRPCPALKDDPGLLARVVAEHFYREGRFELGDTLASEAGLMDAEELRAPYAAMHTVLEQIRVHNLDPALQWAVEHRSHLSPDGGPSAFEFRLHRLKFVQVLQSQGRTAALAYAKRHFGPHASRHLQDIQRLMAAAGPAAAAASHPYADLMSPSCWDAAAREFAKQACSLMGQASESPLTTVVAAGSVALPALLKMAAVMERNSQDLRTVDQLPVEIELGSEFVFRSIFACPVSRDMSTPDNPPMLLPCGHVLCEQSASKLAKARARPFKCPYCPQEARLDALKPLTFPRVD